MAWIARVYKHAATNENSLGFNCVFSSDPDDNSSISVGAEIEENLIRNDPDRQERVYNWTNTTLPCFLLLNHKGAYRNRSTFVYKEKNIDYARGQLKEFVLQPKEVVKPVKCSVFQQVELAIVEEASGKEWDVEKKQWWWAELEKWEVTIVKMKEFFNYVGLRGTAWCSEIGCLTSLDAPELRASSDVKEPISLHKAV